MNSIEKKNHSTATTVVIVTGITFFARLFGFLREILVAKYYGTTSYTDAYIIANNIPTVLFETLGAAILTSFIPMYAKAKNEDGIERADQFTWCLLAILSLICTSLTFMAEIFMKQVVLIFASGFKGEVLNLTIRFSRILFPSIFAMAFMKVFTGYLQIYKRFVTASIATIIGNISIIISLVVANYYDNIMLFVYGSLICLFLQVIYLLPSIIRLGLFNHAKNISCGWKYVKQILPLLIPVFIGTAVHEINAVVDRTLVSGLEEGAVATLNYASKIISLIISVIALSITNITFPIISEAYAKGEMKQYSDSVHRTFNMMIFVMIPVSVLLISFRKEIIFIVFQRGSFGTESTEKTAIALACYAFGLVFTAVQQIEIRIFYSQQNTMYPMIIGAICTGCNIIFDFILIDQLGYYGAALATSIAAMIGCVALTVTLVKRNIFCTETVARILGKHFVAGIVCMFITMISIKLSNIKATNMRAVLLITLISCISCAGYIAVEIAVGNKDVKDLIHSFRLKLL